MLRETLPHELRTQDPALYRDLHSRAARRFGANAAPAQALRDAAKAPDWVLLGELSVITAAARILSAEPAGGERVLARIPAGPPTCRGMARLPVRRKLADGDMGLLSE